MYILNQEFPNTNIVALNVSFSLTLKLKGLALTGLAQWIQHWHAD